MAVAMDIMVTNDPRLGHELSLMALLVAEDGYILSNTLQTNSL